MRAVSFKRWLGGQARPYSANMKSLEIDHEAQERLKRTKNQQADVVPPSPESPAEARDDCARYEGKENETKDVISVGYVAPADCPRGEEMAE